MQSAQSQTPTDPVEALADELLRCSRCGLCLSDCPTYRTVLSERFVARGRNWLARLVAEGLAPLDDEFAEPLFQCLLCAACVATCRSAVNTPDVMVATRYRLWQERGRPAFMRLVFDVLLPNARLLRRVVELIAFAKRSGLSTVARRLGLLRWINARLEGADALIASVPKSFLRDRLVAMGFKRDAVSSPPRFIWPGRGIATALFFIGCGTDFQLPQAGQAAIEVLHASGLDIIVVENACCGLPPYAYGDLEAARRLASKNLGLLQAVGADVIVSDCASCTSFLKDYPRLLGPSAQAVASSVRDFTELAASLDLRFEPTGTAATYHDPCHLCRGQGITDAPRKLVSAACGGLIELPEASWCCGGAGTYNIAHPDLSLAILERKMRNIQRTGAEVLATACPSCIIQLSYGARRFGPPVQVRHVAELVAEALRR